MADRTHRGMCDPDLPCATGVPGRALVAAAGADLCRHHATQRPRPHTVHDPWPHGRIGYIPAASTGILFFAVASCSIAVDDAASACDCGAMTAPALLSSKQLMHFE